MLAVHLEGYLNVLDAALPLMAAAGHGRILGVTSGSGWRAADAGAYSCAKRAVAALTWQLGRQAPPGVTVNAMSPIAATRMMASALERARKAGRSGGGGISFLSVAGPEDLGPFGAYLVGEEFGWCSGRVLFAGGSEVAVIDEPRLLEVVRTDDAVSLAGVLDAVIPAAFAKAEASQASDGGGNPRFGPIFDEPAPTEVDVGARCGRCAVVSDRPDLAASLTAALEARPSPATGSSRSRGFDDAADALHAVVEAAGPIDAVVVASGRRARPGPPRRGWEQVLAEHRGIVEQHPHRRRLGPGRRRLRRGASRPVRLVTLTDATTHGRPQPGPGRGPARPGRRRSHRGAGHGLRRQHRGAGGGGRPDRPASWSPTCSATPRRRHWPGPSWWWATAGSVCAATPDRSAASPTAAPRSPTGSTAPSGRSSGSPAPSSTGGPMTDRPTRVVDAHVHIWDPARPTGTRTCPHPRGPGAGTRRGCTAASMSTPTGPSPPGGTSRSSSTSPPPPAVTRSRRPSSSTGRPWPAAAPTPSSAVSHRPTPWPRPSSSSTGR